MTRKESLNIWRSTIFSNKKAFIIILSKREQIALLPFFVALLIMSHSAFTYGVYTEEL